MAGRRVMRSQRNPLYILFICQLAAIALLLIVSAVLGTRLSNAKRALESANTQIEQLKATAQQGDIGQMEPTTPADTAVDPAPVPEQSAEPAPAQEQTAPAQPSSWLDLSGHSELSVLPETLFDHYYSYFTTTGVNLRSGPGTEYGRIKLLNTNEQVEAAAKIGDWTFVKSGEQFGWISSEFLSTTITQTPAN